MASALLPQRTVAPPDVANKQDLNMMQKKNHNVKQI